jgi:hypothetical protein
VCTSSRGHAPPYSARWKVGGVEAFGDVARLVDPQEEERHPLRAGTLQRRRAVAGLFETDPEARGEVVEIVFRGQRLGQVGAIGHQHGGGEVVRQFHPAPREAVGVGDVGAFGEDVVEERPVLDETGHVDQLEDAVGMVQRLRQQHFAPRLVVFAQRVGHVLHPHQPHAQAEPVAQRGLHLGIDIVRRHVATAPERLGRRFQRLEVVVVAAEEVVHGGLGGGHDDRPALIAAGGHGHQLIGGREIGAVQLQHRGDEVGAVDLGSAKLRQVGASAIEERVLKRRAQVGEVAVSSSSAMSRQSTP